MTVEPDSDPRPQPPREPEPAECCGSGCERCVLDVYGDALARYERALAAWRQRHPGETGGAQNT